MSACKHVWALRKEAPWGRAATAAEKAAEQAQRDALDARLRALYGGQRPARSWASGVSETTIIGTVRHWYCTRCRALEATHHEGVWGE